MEHKSSNLFRRAMAMLLCVAMALSYVVLPVSAADGSGVTLSESGYVVAGDPIEENGLVVNKNVTPTDKPDEFTLTLEAFATGETSQITTTKPADIVLVLDQSSSMYTPLGWTKDRVNLEGGDTYTSIKNTLRGYEISNFTTEATKTNSTVQKNAKSLGYYIAVHNSGNYIYLVHYYNNKWYYISLDQTTRSIDKDALDYAKASSDSNLYGADYKLCTWDNGAIFTNFTYYKTQYGALLESVKSFVANLENTEHRLGIVGFASPFYDGWDHYDGTGLYVDGEFYLYDTDFMYKGTKSGSSITYTNGGFVEEDWTGNVILDPNTTFASGSPVTQELDQDVIDHAYEYSIICKDADGDPTGDTMYTEALAKMNDEDEYDGVLDSIAAITANYQQTCPSVGIEIAENIFAARTGADANRDKIIVLFTDGVPTVRLLSNRHHGYSNDIFANSLYWSLSGGVEDALDRAALAKANGVQLYTIGTAAMEATDILGTDIDSGDFLRYLSSNYESVTYGEPDYTMITSTDHTKAFYMNNMYGGEGMDKDPDHSNIPQSDKARQYAYYDSTPDGDAANDELVFYYRVTPGTGTDAGYAQFATSGSNSLNVAFTTIMESITMPSVTLDGDDILKEVISDYFVLNETEDNPIKVYTALYDGDGNEEDAESFFEWVELEDAGIERTTADSKDYSGVIQNNVINVTGYDYHEAYLRRGDPDDEYCGEKLIVVVPIKARPGFWGGNNVPTNTTDTAIYDVDNDAMVAAFPQPEANVPMVPKITATNKTIYYGNPITEQDLDVSITINGSDVTINANGTLTPAKDWMDDYATLTWDDEDMNPADSTNNASKTVEKTLNYAVTLNPDSDEAGEENSIDEDYSIAGNPVEENTQRASTTATIDILVPVFTFHDTTVKLGHTPDCNTENKTSGPVWVDISTKAAPTGEVFGTKPTLTLTYNTSGPIWEETKVEVTVTSSNDANYQNVTTFKWVDCNVNHADITEHLGNADSIEFNIHVGGILPDTVVIDFGLPVNIHVLNNDDIDNPKLVGVGTSEGTTTSYTGSFGSAKVNSDGTVTYTIGSMQMNGAEEFTYTVQSGSHADHLLSSTVTVIPATTIYYEDNFVDFTVVDGNGNSLVDENGNPKTDDQGNPLTNVTWTQEGTTINDTQDEDRPGEDVNNALGDLDADNIYGYDSAYKNMAQYSMGSAMKVHVDANRTGRAEFTFTGTGFDVISLTSNTTGTIMVRVYKAGTTTLEKALMVDTYYGYKYDGEKWVVDSTASNTLYQVPVIKVEGLTHGTYDVVISASYSRLFDHGQYGDEKAYDFYLDAIRIYDPAKGDTEVEGYHKQDSEGWPTYQELRNMLISVGTFDSLKNETDEAEGVIFIDGNGGNVSISDYTNYGPNNELYLAADQAVAFQLNMSGENSRNVKAVHLAMKSVGNASATVMVYSPSDSDDVVSELNPITISTATDLYYDITHLNGKTVIIYNTQGSAATLSVTNIKVTYTDEVETANTVITAKVRKQTGYDAVASLMALRENTDTETQPVPTITPTYPTLSFDGEVRYNVYYTMQNGENVALEDMGLITFASKLYEGTMADAAEVIPGAATNGTEYMVHTNGIPAKNLGDMVYFKIYVKLADGSYIYSDLMGYNAVYYAEAILGADVDEEMQSLVVAALNYGAEAQKFFGYNTDNLMNAGLTAEQQKLVDPYSADMVAPLTGAKSSKAGAFVSNGGFSNQYPTVSFDGAFAINYYFAPSYEADGDITMYIWDQETYNSVEVLTAQNASGSEILLPAAMDGEYGARYTGMAAKEIDEIVYVAVVYESNGTTYCSGVIAYSVGYYCMAHAETDSSEMQDLGAATAVYGYYAKQYFN